MKHYLSVKYPEQTSKLTISGVGLELRWRTVREADGAIPGIYSIERDWAGKPPWLDQFEQEQLIRFTLQWLLASGVPWREASGVAEAASLPAVASILVYASRPEEHAA